MIDQIHHGDCLDILSQIPNGTVNLVYLDPPFFTQKKQTLKSRKLVTYEFDDKWDSMADYIAYLKLRLVAIKEVMADNATVFVHCDRNASHYIRVMLDEVFGYDHFLSEIIWAYRRWSNSRKNLLPAHQTIYMYSKSDRYTFNTIYTDYSASTNVDQILQRRERNKHGKTVYATDDDNNVILNGPKKGVPLSDTWDIPYLNPKAKERTGYPTQKPLLLLERIIQLSSNPDDIVLDPFCGSGTTCVAATLLNRRYIGIDTSHDAVELSRARIGNPIRSDSSLLKKGRASYENLPDEVQSILNTLPVKPVQRNSGIDAIHDRFVDGRPIVIRVQRDGERLEDGANQLKQAGEKKNAILMILIRRHQDVQQTTFFNLIPPEVTVIDSIDGIIDDIIESHLHTES